MSVAVRFSAFNDGREFSLPSDVYDFIEQQCQHAGELPLRGGRTVSIYRWPSPLAGKTWVYGDAQCFSIELNTRFNRYTSIEHVKAIAWHFNWGPRKASQNVHPNTNNTPNNKRRVSHAVQREMLAK